MFIVGSGHPPEGAMGELSMGCGRSRSEATGLKSTRNVVIR
jgi:hypothetical protein